MKVMHINELHIMTQVELKTCMNESYDYISAMVFQKVSFKKIDSIFSIALIIGNNIND